MMFRPDNGIARRISMALAGAAIFAAALPAQAGSLGYAVVPRTTIYPGETVSESAVQEVEVTNPNLAGGYARSVHEVVGQVAVRTLLPGRTIQVSSVREPYAMTRGANVRLVFSLGPMTISAAGSPLTDAAVGDVIRARNLDTGVIVSGTVMADGTIHVVAK